MKICIPSSGKGGLEDEIGEHFGRSPTYTVVDLESGDVRVIKNTSIHMGGNLYPSEIIAREGVKIMICRGIGRKALSMFKELGIDVYIGAEGTVRDCIDMFKQGKLKKANLEDGCPGRHTH